MIDAREQWIYEMETALYEILRDLEDASHLYDITSLSRERCEEIYTQFGYLFNEVSPGIQQGPSRIGSPRIV